MFTDLWFRLRALVRRRTVEQELDEELRSHLAHEVEKLMLSGLSIEEASRRAQLAMGGLSQVKEECREARGVTWIETTAADIRYAFRGMRRSPAYALAAVLTLGLGSGAVSTVLTIGNTLLFRNLPVDGADELVVVQATRRHGQMPGWVGYADYTQFRSTKTIEDLAAHYSTSPLFVTVGNRSQEVSGAVVSANYFATLRLRPALGRFFSAEEDRVPDRDRVVVVSHRFWREWLASSPDAIGTSLRINGTVFSVIGVAQETFRGLLPVPNEVYLPSMMTRVGYRFCRDAFGSGCTIYSMLGRLRPGVSIVRAQSEMQTLMPAAWSNAKDGENSGVTVYRAQGVLYPNQGRTDEVRFVSLLGGVAAVLLLVCCVNLAGLQTARNDARCREFGIRASLGAGTNRLTRQLLTESLVLAMLGGTAGIVVSVLLINYLESAFCSMDYAGRPLHYGFTPDFNVLAAVLAVSCGAGLLMGAWPALRTSRSVAHESLRSRSTGTGRATAVGRWLAGVQAGFAVALAVVAGLLIASTRAVLSGHNFEPSQVALMRLRPRLIQYTPAEAQQYIRKVMNRLNESAGVESATMVGNGAALVGGSGTVSLPGASEGQAAEIGSIQIGPRYFETLRTPVLQGREFGASDDTRAPLVAIVNEALARRLWKESTAIGATLMVNRRPHQIIGVVANVELQSRDRAVEPYVYTAFWQDPAITDARLCIRVKGDLLTMIPGLVRSVNQVGPDVPVTETVTLGRQLDGTSRELQLTGAFVSYAAVLAIALSIVGLYGALASAVQRRRKEMGIRLAVGANPAELVAMVIREGMSVILAGVALGVLMAMAAAQLLRHLLYGSGSTDVMIYVAAALVVLGTSLIACSIPGYRAASVAPVAALREE